MNSDAVPTEVTPDPPGLCEYAADVTAQRLDRMLSHIDGVRKGEDPAPVHQMRVWSRRSRAALEIFRVCFAGKAFAEVEREVKTAADALGEARDLDVMVANLSARASKLPASQRSGVESFTAKLQAQRDARQHAVAHAVTALESHNLAARFRELTDAAAAARDADAEAEVNPGGHRRRGKRHGGKQPGGKRKGRNG